MRRLGTAVGLTVATALLTGAAGLGVAAADETIDVPSQAEVDQAQGAARDAAGSVAEVRARLAVAEARLESAGVAAARAAEAYNGAQWRAGQAREAARAARTRSTQAAAAQERLRADYAALAVSAYQQAPQLAALAAITDADGLGSVLETSSALRSGQAALDARYDELRAGTLLAEAAADRAVDARRDADRAADQARDARDSAAAAADAADAEAASVAQERTELLADLARLQHVSVALAEQRQAGLEERARAAAAAAAEREARQAARRAARQAAEQAAEAAEQAEQAEQATQGDRDQQDGQAPPQEQDEQEQDEQEQDDAPAPSSGVPAVLAFARAQLGEPYRWAAAGPDAWDCSGLTAGAWAAAGKSLPHYSVAQYEQSTPIRSSELRPGDLVFWGDSDDPSSIYHVALYAGDGMIIHAPRTGKPVTEESMYYWITPNFYARP